MTGKNSLPKGFTEICSLMDSINFTLEQNIILNNTAVVRKYRKRMELHAKVCPHCVREKNEPLD